MDLSLVIICCNDPHVFKTIDSLDIDIPIIVSLTPNPYLEDALHERSVEIVNSTPGNCSISYNRGLEKVKTKRVFVVDSDCTLESGCLEYINTQLDISPIVRARVNFKFSHRIRWSKQIAKLRDSINNSNPVPAYMPGLGFRMEIKSLLGGYFFDERLFWASDSELDKRIKKAGLNVQYIPEAVVSHNPISLKHELYSGFKHGMGTRAQVILGLRPPYENPDWLLKRLIGWKKKRKHKKQKSLPKDLITRLIHIGWMIGFYLGYYRDFFRQPKDFKAT